MGKIRIYAVKIDVQTRSLDTTVTPENSGGFMVDKDVTQKDELETENLSEDTQDESESEKMLPVSRVNELIGKAKHKGEMKMQDKLDEVTQELQNLKESQSQGQSQMGMGGVSQVNSDEIRQQILEQVKQDLISQQEQQQQKLVEDQARQVADQYHSKMNLGKEKYDDWDAVTADFEPEAFPELVYLANQSDNTADIIYELRKNPTKLVTLNNLVKSSPRLAKSELAKLSDSIKTNQEAIQDEKQVAEPLDRLKPSSVGVDNGQQSIQDLRRNNSLRG